MPTDVIAYARSVATELRRILWSNQRGIDVHRDLNAGHGSEHLDEFPYGHGSTACHVVDEGTDRTRGTAAGLQEETVRPDDVTDIAEVPSHVDVARSDGTVLAVSRGHDPGGESRNHELGPLPRPGVVEGPDEHKRDPLAAPISRAARSWANLESPYG